MRTEHVCFSDGDYHLQNLKHLLSSRVGTGICPETGFPELQSKTGQVVGQDSREGGLSSHVFLPWEGSQELGRSRTMRGFQVGVGCESQFQALGEGSRETQALLLKATSGGHHRGQVSLSPESLTAEGT